MLPISSIYFLLGILIIISYLKQTMKNDDIRKAIDQLQNDIYYEKLGPIIAELRTWLTEKDQLIGEYIMKTSQNIIKDSASINEEIQVYFENLKEIFSQVAQSFSYILLQPPKTKRSNSKKYIEQNKPIQMFKKSRQTWQERKEKLRKVHQYAQIIIGRSKKQNQQNNKLFQEVINIGKKIKINVEWSDAEYMKKFAITSVKNHHKQYEINKIKKIAEMFNGEIKEYSDLWGKLKEVNQHYMKSQQVFLDNMHQNVVSFCGTMSECLVGFDYEMIDQSLQFMKKIKKSIADIRQNLKQIDYIKMKGSAQLKQKLQQISSKALQQILVASWDIKYKGTDDFQFKPRKGIITLDNKFYILEKNEKFMSLQINLTEATINDTQNLGQIVLKSKKKSRTYPKHMIKFEKLENEDEFKLHLKRAQGLIQ